jgi:hypothetical protein
MNDDSWNFHYDEPCVCGHAGNAHCLDDDHCYWDEEDRERGGYCFEACGCCTYRPKSLHEIRVHEEE